MTVAANSFYRAFEDRYRGSRELIKSRLRAYSDVLDAVRSHLLPAPALDLGCGRGEWLELLGECGIPAQGVDVDDGMLEACRSRGLDVRNADALATLRAMPDATLSLVSAFHVVEHIAFDDLLALTQEAHRVLVPGGILIFETPNTENLSVGTSSFYLDPTHAKPIPSALLDFVVDHTGFARQTVRRLQEAPALHDAGATIDLFTVLEGVSPDYAVVAQKAGSSAILHLFDAAFAATKGLSLHSLATRYDADRAERLRGLANEGIALREETRNLERRIGEVVQAVQAVEGAVRAAIGRERQMETRAIGAELRLAQLEAGLNEARALMQRPDTRVDDIERAHHAELQLADARRLMQLSAMEARIQAIHLSTSWRLTKPIRLAGRLLKPRQWPVLWRHLRTAPALAPEAPSPASTPASPVAPAPEAPAPVTVATERQPSALALAPRPADLSEDTWQIARQLNLTGEDARKAD